MNKISRQILSAISKNDHIDFYKILQLLLHPILVPLWIIPAWSKSLWNARILLWGRWSDYHGFHARNAINNLFYRTQWININRYGRLAHSPVIGLGDFPLSHWWHLSSIASYFYAYAGAVTTLLATLFWALSHLIWMQSIAWHWVLAVTVLLFFSSTTYLMAFARQNYQMLAWMWFPIALYGLLNQQFIVAAFGFFAAGLLGLTAFAISIPIVLIQALDSAEYLYIFVLLPALLPTLLKLAPVLRKGDLGKSALMLGKLIGLTHQDVKYKRKSMSLGAFNLYFLLLYGVALGMIWISKGETPLLLAFSYVLFLINQRFHRFADEQSVILVFVMSATAEVLQLPGHWLALSGLALAVNPSPKLFASGQLLAPAIFAPFDISPTLKKLRKLLELPPMSRVMFAFSDPADEYENIFDGYRILIEAPLAVAAEREIHLFPDWHAVYETNHAGAPSIWGRSKADVGKNLAFWDADYAIVYQDSGTELDKDWLASFTVVGEFDWGDESLGISGDLVAPGKKLPKWWLLQRNGTRT